MVVPRTIWRRSGQNPSPEAASAQAAKAPWMPRCGYNLWGAETARVGRPFAKADGDHIGDDTADITLLRRVVVGAGMIAGNRHRPAFMPGVQLRQEACGVVDITTRIEHVFDAAELVAMIAMVDLHAAEVDQGLAFAPCRLEGNKRFRPGTWENSFSFYIQGIGLKAALVAGFRQANRVENAGGDPILVRGAQDLSLARIGRGCGVAGGECAR